MRTSCNYHSFAICVLASIAVGACSIEGKNIAVKRNASIEAVMSDRKDCDRQADNAKAMEEAKQNEPFAKGLLGTIAHARVQRECLNARGYSEQKISDENARFYDSLQTTQERNDFQAVLGSGGTIEVYKQKFGRRQP